MCSICILASRKYFGCQAACRIACHSLLSETAVSGRCSFSDDLNFHFSDTSLFILYTRQDREHGAASSHLAIQRSKSQHFSARPHTVIRTEADKYLLKRGEDEEGEEQVKISREHLTFSLHKHTCRQTNSHQHHHQ